MTYRVIQWATGSMGKTCLRSVIDHPDLELAGLYVHSDKKAGQDAGDIARRPPTGIIATQNIDDILAIDADVVLHCPMLKMPYSAYDEDVCRLLEAGKNVVSINNYFHPKTVGEDYAARLEASCMKGGTTLAGTGINPGWVAERVAAMATGLCVELDSIYCREVFDCRGMPSADYVFGIMGMGTAPGEIDLENGPFATLFGNLFSQCVGALADRLGWHLDEIVADNQITLAPEDIVTRAGIVPKGTVAATNWQQHGLMDGRRVITHSVNWVMRKDLPGYENAAHWDIAIRGKPGLDIRMELIEPDDDTVKTKAEQYGVAGAVIQAIPLVCNAAPGLFQFPSVPTFRARF